MKIQCWSIGKSNDNYVNEGIQLFSARIEHYFPFSWNILTPPKQAATMDTRVLKEEEGKKVLEMLQPNDKLILLDEPAFGLDIFTAKPIFEMINEAKKEGIGIVYASGNLSNIEMFGDDIIFLHQGKMVYQSPLQTFLQGFDNSADKGFIHVISEVEKSTQ